MAESYWHSRHSRHSFISEVVRSHSPCSHSLHYYVLLAKEATVITVLLDIFRRAVMVNESLDIACSKRCVCVCTIHAQCFLRTWFGHSPDSRRDHLRLGKGHYVVAQEMAQPLRACVALSWGPGFGCQDPCQEAHKCLQLQLQEIWELTLTCMRIHTQTK